MGHQWTPGPEQGVIGLRLDHLCRHAATRAAVVNLLMPANADPLAIAQNIPVAGGAVNVFDDDVLTFANALHGLTPGAGSAYLADTASLRERNRDMPKDRADFKNFWMAAAANNAGLVPQMRQKLLTALQSPKKVRFLWDCDLPGGSPPEVEHLELPQAFHVLFRTDDVPTP